MGENFQGAIRRAYSHTEGPSLSCCLCWPFHMWVGVSQNSSPHSHCHTPNLRQPLHCSLPLVHSSHLYHSELSHQSWSYYYSSYVLECLSTICRRCLNSSAGTPHSFQLCSQPFLALAAWNHLWASERNMLTRASFGGKSHFFSSYGSFHTHLLWGCFLRSHSPLIVKCYWWYAHHPNTLNLTSPTELEQLHVESVSFIIQ